MTEKKNVALNRIALIIAIFAFFLAILAIIFATRSAKSPVIRNQIIGVIEIINDCDRMLASIPNQVIVNTALNDNQGQKATGSVIINLASNPNDPPGFIRKIGRYSIRDVDVVMPPGFGTPISWDSPVATPPGGGAICNVIPCPVAGNQCNAGPLIGGALPLLQVITVADFRVLCSCQ